MGLRDACLVLAFLCICGAAFRTRIPPDARKLFAINDLGRLECRRCRNTTFCFRNRVSTWPGALNLGMERPYAIGGGLRLLVDLIQHHVAFTTHPNQCSTWEVCRAGRFRGGVRAIVPLSALWVNNQCPPIRQQNQNRRRMYRLGKRCVLAHGGSRRCWCSRPRRMAKSTIRLMLTRLDGTWTVRIATHGCSRRDTWPTAVLLAAPVKRSRLWPVMVPRSCCCIRSNRFVPWTI